MSRTRNRQVSLLLFASLCMVPFANSGSTQEEHEEFWKTVRTVEAILAGDKAEGTLATVSQGASLIWGGRFEKLKAVVAGEIKGLTLADTSYHGVMIQARTNSSEDMGYLILKTQKYDTTKVRYHSVVFLKDSTGQYRILSWHTGG